MLEILFFIDILCAHVPYICELTARSSQKSESNFNIEASLTDFVINFNKTGLFPISPQLTKLLSCDLWVLILAGWDGSKGS